MKRHTTHTRDAALRELNRINRWVIAGSVVLTGVLADVAANAFPGKTVKSAGAKASKAHTKHSGSASHTTTGVLRAPEQAPQASSEAQPSQESAPSEPAREAAPQESAPAQEAAPEQQSAPQESAPTQEAAPEESGPVVSGGS
jgi:hypothetical protein